MWREKHRAAAVLALTRRVAEKGLLYPEPSHVRLELAHVDPVWRDDPADLCTLVCDAAKKKS
jgi:hypothetical protein